MGSSIKFDLRPMIQLGRYLPVMAMNLGTSRLKRVPETFSITDNADQVADYDQVLSTKLAIFYAIGQEIVFRARGEGGGSALDLACGPGHYTLQLAQHFDFDSILGLDLSPNMIATSERNAQKMNLANRVRFAMTDVSDLSDHEAGAFHLTSCTDALHHLPDLGVVERTICEMVRVTHPAGLIMIMDVARLNTAKATERFVALAAKDYKDRGLDHFYSDFYESMYAAWTPAELRHLLPRDCGRTWVQMFPKGLPALQVILGLPTGRSNPLVREGTPWPRDEVPLATEHHGEWVTLRHLLFRGHMISLGSV